MRVPAKLAAVPNAPSQSEVKHSQGLFPMAKTLKLAMAKAKKIASNELTDLYFKKNKLISPGCSDSPHQSSQFILINITGIDCRDDLSPEHNDYPVA